MENQSPPTSSTDHVGAIAVWVDPGLSANWPGAFSSPRIQLCAETEAQWKIEERNGLFEVFHKGHKEVGLPAAKPNLKFIEELVTQKPLNPNHSATRSDDLLAELADKCSALFLGSEGTGLAPFLSSISTTISLKNGLDAFFRLKSLQNHRPGLLYVHQKGEPRAWQMGIGPNGADLTRAIEIESFNQLLSAVKKTKTGQYSTQTSKWSWLPFSGAFLAEEFSFREFNTILVSTRQEFLPFAAEEVAQFHNLARLLGLWLEDLVEGEFSDLRLAEVMVLLERSPMPIILKDKQDQPLFTNEAFQSSDISTIQWQAVGQGHHLGIGPLKEAEGAEIDVLHRHKVGLLGDLFNTLGHELSNPLFGLGLASELLSASTENGDSVMMLREIEKNIKRCQLIIQNLSKLYAEDSQDERCDLRMAIKEALTLAKSELKGIRQDIDQVTADSTPVIVDARPIAVVQILFNLLVNSAQAMAKQSTTPQLQVRLRGEGATAQVDVIDNGPGIPPVVREHMFRPFATTKAKGHGLGLALSHNLAQKAGGNLEVVPSDLGAHFRLTLKRAP